MWSAKPSKFCGLCATAVRIFDDTAESIVELIMSAFCRPSPYRAALLFRQHAFLSLALLHIALWSSSPALARTPLIIGSGTSRSVVDPPQSSAGPYSQTSEIQKPPAIRGSSVSTEKTSSYLDNAASENLPKYQSAAVLLQYRKVASRLRPRGRISGISVSAYHQQEATPGRAMYDNLPRFKEHGALSRRYGLTRAKYGER